MKLFHAALLILSFARAELAVAEGHGYEDGPSTPAGLLEATVDGRKYEFPALSLDVSAEIEGDLATVTVVQTFVNPLDKPLHATYLFPLFENAAVYAMTMDVGDERIRAVVKQKDEALKTFEEAKEQGKTASLLTQHRPNMFTQDIANLMPGLPVKVELKYVHVVDKVDGAYKLVIPLIVGPRYQPKASKDTEPLPEYPAVSGLTMPELVEKDRVTLKVLLKAATSISDVKSRTHAVAVSEGSSGEQVVELKGGKTIDNRDFVLGFTLGGDRTTAGLLTHKDGRGGFFSLLLQPPLVPAESEISPREMVFVLDCSGSMEGLPLNASKAFMRKALTKLRATDTFRIIRFSETASEFGSEPLEATPENIKRGIRYTDGLNGEGGTEMTKGISLALRKSAPAGAVRIVVFLTDGYIGNEHEIIGLLRSHLGDARLYAFGVGTGVNRYLLNKMGLVGRGFTRFMSPTEDVETVANELASRLDAPVLTDISVDWGSLEVESQTPSRVPDLFAGQSVRVQGRYAKPGTYQIQIRGRSGGKPVTLPLTLALPSVESSGEAIAVIWARSMVEELTDALSTPFADRDAPATDEALKAAVTTLGIDFGLVTQWTSFVAVSEEVYNQDPDGTKHANVPLSQVAGVSETAYEGFGGSSAPEPGVMAGLVLILAMAFVAMRLSNRMLGG